MQVYDEEGKKRVARHRAMRSGKGFVTIEQPVEIEKALEKIKQIESESELLQNNFGRAALMECMSNLKMFWRWKKKTERNGQLKS